MPRSLLTLPLTLALAASAVGAQDVPAPQDQATAPAPAAGSSPPSSPPTVRKAWSSMSRAASPRRCPSPSPPCRPARWCRTPAGTTDVVGQKLSEIIANDLRNSGLFTPIPPAQLRTVSFPEVTAPAFDYWNGTGAQALVQGYVRANGDGTLTVGCYLYDVLAKSELARQGFVVSPGDWRRAAHKCADTIYTKLTGEGPYFDSRITYVSETGPKAHRIKRLAIMDQDGANHRFLTNGQSIVLTPRFAPNQQSIVYMSYIDKRPAIYVYDIGTGRQRLVVQNAATTFAPRFSPDGRWILFSMAQVVTPISIACRRRGHAAAPDQRARHRHGRQLFARRIEDRLRKRSLGRAADLRHECRWFEPAADQLRWRALCNAGLEPARRPDRLYEAWRGVSASAS